MSSRTAEGSTIKFDITCGDGEIYGSFTLCISWTYLPGYRATWEEPGESPAAEFAGCTRVDGELEPWQAAIGRAWVAKHEQWLIEQARNDGSDPDAARDRILDDAMMGGA